MSEIKVIKETEGNKETEGIKETLVDSSTSAKEPDEQPAKKTIELKEAPCKLGEQVMVLTAQNADDYAAFESALYAMWNDRCNGEDQPVQYKKDQLPLAKFYEDGTIALDKYLSMNDFCGEDIHCKFGFDKAQKGIVVKRDIQKKKFVKGLNHYLKTVELK